MKTVAMLENNIRYKKESISGATAVLLEDTGSVLMDCEKKKKKHSLIIKDRKINGNMRIAVKL